MSESPQHLPDQWLSFELRMRQRRFVRCLQNAETALDAGLRDEARAALEEARQLQNDSPELSSLESRLGAPDLPMPDAQGDPDETLEPLSTPPTRSRNYKALVAVAAGVGVLISGGAIAALYWSQPEAPRDTTIAPQAARPVEIQRVATAVVTPVKQVLAQLRVVHDTITAHETAPRLLVVEPLLPSYPGPPIAAPEPQPEPEPVMLAVNRGETTSSPPEPRIEPRLDPVMPPTAPVDPPGRSVEPAAPPVATPAVRSTPPPAAAEEAPIVRDESVVRAVLRRYETAYSTLDADAASIIWPGVNRSALARAFDGLASQQVSLGSCDVTVNGPAARATCSGSATWQPKVGGGVRTEARRWSFDLRKNGEAWRIERAVAR